MVHIKIGFWKFVVASALTFTSVASAADYTIDADHSLVGFKIKHLAISSVSGRFVNLEGSFTFDPKNLKDSKTEAVIGVASIDTRQAKRDEHLKGPDFFDTSKFPKLKFVSKEIQGGSPESFKMAGDLTIKDVTKPVTLDVTFGGAATDPWGNERAAFSATAKINRKDFGLTWNKILETGSLVVGDDVTIELEIEGIKKKA